jgi:hypothetical protein
LYRERAEMAGKERGGSGAGGASILPLLQQISLKSSITLSHLNSHLNGPG